MTTEPAAQNLHVGRPFPRNRLLQALVGCYGVVWLALGVAPPDRQTWMLENLLVVAVALLLVLTHRRFVFSNLSYLLVTAFLLLHAVGAHSTYSAAAPGAWLERAIGLARNPYDRIVHFCFGLLLGYPLRELTRRVWHVQGAAAYVIPVAALLALSSLYEILEGWAARIVDPAQGIAFVGAQGDAWDAQKDMSLALSGAVVSMLATALYRRRSGREPWGILALLALILLAPLSADASSGPAQTGLFAPANDAASANLNPAGLTRIDRPEWVFQGLYFTSESTFEQESSADPGISVEDDDDGSTLIPFVYYACPLSERLGFGFYVTGVSFSENLDDDNPSRYLVDEWQLGSASLVPSLAYRIGESLSLGASLAINYNFYEFESAVFNGPNQPDGTMKLEDDDISFGFALGLLYEFTPDTRAGLIFRSETEANFDDTPSFRGLSPAREALLRNAGLLDQKVRFDSTFPASVGAGFYHRFDSGSSFTLDLLWSNFEEFGMSEIRLGGSSITVTEGNFENVVAGSIGYAWRLNERWELRVGGLYIDQPIKDSNRTFAFRLDRVWGAGIGAEYAIAPGRIFGLSLTYYDLGEGKSTGRDPRDGAFLSGKFTERYAILLDATFRWVR